MSDRPTPETDAFIASQNHSPTTHQLRNFARIFEQERDEAREKYDNEAVEHMLAINKLCNEREILRLDAQKEAERINYLERKLNKEINEANQDHLGWENKWKVAVDMAAIAENKVSNLEDQLDLAMKVIKRLEANQP